MLSALQLSTSSLPEVVVFVIEAFLAVAVQVEILAAKLSFINGAYFNKRQGIEST